MDGQTDFAARLAALVELADLTTPMAVRVAATLRLADHVYGGTTTAAGLAAATHSHPRPLRKVMDHLADIGIFGRSDGGGYELMPLGELLLSSNDHFCVRPMLDREHILGRADMAMTHLLDVVRTGGTSYESCYGRSLWDDVDDLPDLDGVAMLAKAQPVLDGGFVVDDYDWSRVKHVVDVGGNTGAILTNLLTTHPHLHGTLVELPMFAELAAQRFADAGLSGRADVVRGSFFEELPEGADRYLLSSVLADWSDEDAVRILLACRAAAGPSGRILLFETHLTGADVSFGAATAGAIRLETDMHDPDRTVDDLVGLAEQARLELVRQSRSRYRSLLELVPRAAGP